MSFKILGTGSYAPEHVVTNDDLSALVDTNDEWITQRIGVRSRHISETETNVDMAVKAAERVWTAWALRHGIDAATFVPTIHGARADDTIRRLLAGIR